MQTAGAAAGTINLTELMDNCRIGPLQVRVFALCLASLIMDGFDVQVMGFVATTMFAEWNVPPPTLGGLLAWTRRRARRCHHLQHDGRQDRTPPRPGRGDAVLCGHDGGDGFRAGRRADALAAVHCGLRPRIHHSERDGARRRVQPEANARRLDHVHHGGLHGRRRDQRLRRERAHRRVRLARRVRVRRHRAARDRDLHVGVVAGVFAVSRRSRAEPRATRELAEAARSHAADWLGVLGSRPTRRVARASRSGTCFARVVRW